MEILIGVLFAFGIVIGLATLRGFVAAYLWYWFVVPLGVAAISVPQAIGIALLLGMFTNNASKKDDDESMEEKVGRLILLGVVAPLLTLLVGYVVHLIMKG